MSKALMLSYWNVSNPAFGGGRRINALIGALRGRVVLCQPGPPHPACETATYATDFGRRKHGINWGMFNFLWPANAHLARRRVERLRPPVIVMTSMWNYFPLRDLKDIPIVLDSHDVNVIAVGERMGMRHPFTRMVGAWERFVAGRVDHIFTCSPQDRDQFIHLYGVDPGRVSIAPNGVTLAERGADPDDVSRGGGPAAGTVTLFFMGKLDYQPNAEGLAFLNERVMPELARRAPGRFRLVVTGGPVPQRPFHPTITFAGVLPNAELAETVRSADICLAPIFSGSGTRVKILEYMAAGRPVVATPKGTEELACTAGKDILLAEPSSFVDAILALAADPPLARRLGVAGWELVRSRYDWVHASYPPWRAVLDRWLPADAAVETP